MTQEEILQILSDDSWVSKLLFISQRTAIREACKLLKNFTWIPITERLPEKRVIVLVRDDRNNTDNGYLRKDGSWEFEHHTDFNVKYWMP